MHRGPPTWVSRSIIAPLWIKGPVSGRRGHGALPYSEREKGEMARANRLDPRDKAGIDHPRHRGRGSDTAIKSGGMGCIEEVDLSWLRGEEGEPERRGGELRELGPHSGVRSPSRREDSLFFGVHVCQDLILVGWTTQRRHSLWVSYPLVAPARQPARSREPRTRMRAGLVAQNFCCDWT